MNNKLTDLEALESIVVDLTPMAKEHNKEEIEQVKKSLEILEILKTEIFNDMHCFDLEDGWYDDSFSLSKNQRQIIKEWLEKNRLMKKELCD